MYHVLLPVDEHEERARNQARFVTGIPVSADDISVSLLHAWSGSHDSAPEENVDTQTITRVGSVREACDILDEANVDYDLIDGAGDPADLILDIVDDDAPDLIVISRGEHSPVGKAVFGSVTQRVLLNTSVPVTVVNPHEP